MSTAREVHSYHTSTFEQQNSRQFAYQPSYHPENYPAYHPSRHHQQSQLNPPPAHPYYTPHQESDRSPRRAPHSLFPPRSTSQSSGPPPSRTVDIKSEHLDHYHRPSAQQQSRYSPVITTPHPHQLDPYHRTPTSAIESSSARRLSWQRPSSGLVEHRPRSLPSIASFDTGRGSSLNSILAPIRSRTPQTHRQVSNRVESHHLPVPYEPASRKRTRENDISVLNPSQTTSPSDRNLSRPHSRPNSPQYSPKRRCNTISNLLINDDEADIKPTLSPTSSIWSHDSTSSLRSITDFTDLPPPRRTPIPTITMSHQWNGTPIFTQLANTNPTAGPASGGSNPERPGGIAIDPALSSVRSGQSNPSGPNSPGMVIAPELRFTDETLASAINDPAVAALGNMDMDFEDEKGEDGEGGLEVPDKKDQPFSRSPELRVSHKLAERKRRKEMKDMFDELRELLPAERGTKSSKWEILSKSIDYISSIKTALAEATKQNENLKRELDAARGVPSSSSGNLPTGTPYSHNPYYAISPAFTPQANGTGYATSTPASAGAVPGTLAQQQSINVGLSGVGVDGGLGSGLVAQQQVVGVGQPQNLGIGQIGGTEIHSQTMSGEL